MDVGKIVIAIAAAYLAAGVYLGNDFLVAISSMLCISELTVLRIADITSREQVRRVDKEIILKKLSKNQGE